MKKIKQNCVLSFVIVTFVAGFAEYKAETRMLLPIPKHSRKNKI